MSADIKKIMSEPDARGQDIQGALARFAQGIRCKTVSKVGDDNHNLGEFLAFHAHLEKSYPLIASQLHRRKMGTSSLLYEWQGSSPDKPAILLMAHMDVYSVEETDREAWACDPFEGKTDSQFLWGRGSWDDKASLFSIMEAVESLLVSHWQPERTIFLALGSDEAVGGTRDVVKIADHLRQRNIKIELMMVEGLVITDGILPGVDRPVALVGIAEKGYLSVKLKKVTGPCFASSPPPLEETAAGALSLKVNRLLNDNFKPQLGGVTGQMFGAIALHAKVLHRLVFSNLAVFGTLLVGQLIKSPTSLATIKTTVSLVAFHCENNDNMLPSEASCILNIRTLPGDSISDVVDRIIHWIDDDSINLEILPGSHEHSPIESTGTAAFKMVSDNIKKSFGDVLVAPGLMVGATAARHFYDICEHIYRFTPIFANKEDLARFHGNNERIAINNFRQAIDFYRNLLIHYER